MGVPPGTPILSPVRRTLRKAGLHSTVVGDDANPILDRDRVLGNNAAGYARVALTNIEKEFPNDVRYLMKEPGDFPHRPRAITPVFFGSYDWHSCVEMHWVLVRLLRVCQDAIPSAEITDVLDRQFSSEGLEAEARFADEYRNRQRPYGWGWGLMLCHELTRLEYQDADRWANNFGPLAQVLTDCFLEWLPKATYPQRYGMHTNSAFGLARALPHAHELAGTGDPALLNAISASAERWYGNDAGYPAEWEPSGSDFLSPALVEAELMARLLAPADFSEWLASFLPGLADGRPVSLFTPALVSDSTDGQIAHLHGLNASRAWCWRRLAESLPDGDERVAFALAAARTHAESALPHVSGDDYMVEHWLACYAVLLLS